MSEHAGSPDPATPLKKFSGAQDPPVMSHGIKNQMPKEKRHPLGRAPGPPGKARDVGSHHRTGMIERKDGIKADLLELPLAYNRASSADHLLVSDRTGQELLNEERIPRA